MWKWAAVGAAFTLCCCCCVCHRWPCPLAAPSSLLPCDQRWVTSTTTISPDLPRCLGLSCTWLVPQQEGKQMFLPLLDQRPASWTFSRWLLMGICTVPRKLPTHPPDCRLLLWPPYTIHTGCHFDPTLWNENHMQFTLYLLISKDPQPPVRVHWGAHIYIPSVTKGIILV